MTAILFKGRRRAYTMARHCAQSFDILTGVGTGHVDMQLSQHRRGSEGSS